MYVNRLRIENWKNFKSANVELGHRLFLVGPNASGKSNFLDIFRFLRDVSVSGGGLQQAVMGRRGGVGAIRCLAARKYSDIVIDVDLREESSDETWRYYLSFSQNNNRQPIIQQERVEHNGDVKVNRPDKLDKSDSPRLTETALEQTSANRDFRPVVRFFESVSYQHLLPQVIRDPQGFSPSTVENDPFGRDFLRRVDNTPLRTRESRLKKILDAMKVAAPQLEELKIERDHFGVPHLVGLYMHWRHNPGKQNEAQFSDGTLRLFGLLWTLFEGDGPLLLEEPELSLHSEVVRHLPQLIERVHKHRKIKRQVIISTHSEAMLSDPGIGGEELLRLEPSAEGTLLMSPAQDPVDREMLEKGFTAAEVVLPKSAPNNSGQLAFSFSK